MQTICYCCLCCHCRRREFGTDIVDTGGKFAAGVAIDVNRTKDVTASVGYTSCKFVSGVDVDNTCGQLAAGVGVSWWCTYSCEYLQKFSNKVETLLA